MTTLSGHEIAELRQQFPDLTWNEFAAEHEPGSTGNALRKRLERHKMQMQIDGALDDEPRVDRGEIWRRAMTYTARMYETRQRRDVRAVRYERGPVLLIAMGDIHAGSMGVDYIRLHHDMELLQGLYERGVQVGVVLAGDMLDNFIIGKLQNLRKTVSPFLAIEEWGLVDLVLEKLGPMVIAVCAGNHDNWTYALSGVDYLEERVRHHLGRVLYDMHELAFDLHIGDVEKRVMVRHKWRGFSQYNPTHAVEKAAAFNRAAPFDIGIAAHTHTGAVVREFNNGGQVGYALQVGSYKIEDEYARAGGFSTPPDTTICGVLIDSDGASVGSSDLYMLARLAESMA